MDQPDTCDDRAYPVGRICPDCDGDIIFPGLRPGERTCYDCGRVWNVRGDAS